MDQLRVAIAMVNSTRVDAGLATGVSSWIAAAMKHLKEWAGMGALAGLLVLVTLVCLWYICKIRVSQQRNAAMTIQAFTAMEAGQSPQAWLATIKSQNITLRMRGEALHSGSAALDPEKSMSDCMRVDAPGPASEKKVSDGSDALWVDDT